MWNYETLLSSMSNLQNHNQFKLDYQKVDQHTGGKWDIDGTKRRKDNRLQSLELRCRISWWECKHDINESEGNMFNPIFKEKISSLIHCMRTVIELEIACFFRLIMQQASLVIYLRSIDVNLSWTAGRMDVRHVSSFICNKLQYYSIRHFPVNILNIVFELKPTV